jgi:hypothetical protein
MEHRDEIPAPMARLQPQVYETRGLTVLQFSGEAISFESPAPGLCPQELKPNQHSAAR